MRARWKFLVQAQHDQRDRDQERLRDHESGAAGGQKHAGEGIELDASRLQVQTA
jgi:hypothetical protein